LTESNFCDIIIKMSDPIFSPHILRAETLEDGVTQSELSMFDECAFKWNARYNWLLQRADHFPWPLFVGAAWHNFQEAFHKDPNCDVTKFVEPVIPGNIARDSEFEKWLDYWACVMPAYQQVYARIYEEERHHEWFIVEEELSANLLDFKIRGKIDLASETLKFIRDFKSTASAWLTAPDGWQFKLQFMTYCWLMVQNYPKWGKKKFAFQLDMMQKPGLKQTKADGTWTGHITRVCNDIASRPEFYFQRSSCDIFPEAIKRFEDEVLVPKLQRLALVRDNPAECESIILNKNTNACNSFGNRCEFWDICEKGWDVSKFFFQNREIKHQEL